MDEQFKVAKDANGNMIGSGYSGFDQVKDAGSAFVHYFTNLTVNKSGYLYIYTSNEATNIDVFFDNLQVTHIRGPLLEETHYYPFGLTMSGISSKALAFGNIETKQKFVGQELDEELDVSWYQFKYRNHDPQIGRFIQIDPISDAYEYNSTYAYAENKVITGIDAEGLEYITRIHNEDANGNVTTEDIVYYKMSESKIKEMNGTYRGLYNAASYGDQGKGVQHIYYYKDGKQKIYWDNERVDFASRTGNHGLYSGPGCITDADGKYDFSFQPVDWADAIAKRHDMDYQAATSEGAPYAGYLEDIRTYQADVDMVKRVIDIKKDIANLFRKNHVDGVEAPFRKSSSIEMNLALDGQLYTIAAFAIYKKWKIDNNKTNDDKYETLREDFKKYNKGAAAIIDILKSQTE